MPAILMRSGIGNCTELELLGIECVKNSILTHRKREKHIFDPPHILV